MCLSLKFYTQPNYESRVRGRPFSDEKGIKKLASHEDVLRNLLQDVLQQNEREKRAPGEQRCELANSTEALLQRGSRATD